MIKLNKLKQWLVFSLLGCCLAETAEEYMSNMKKTLITYYSQVAPEKVSNTENIASVASDYYGRSSLLFENLERKYGVPVESFMEAAQEDLDDDSYSHTCYQDDNSKFLLYDGECFL